MTPRKAPQDPARPLPLRSCDQGMMTRTGDASRRSVEKCHEGGNLPAK
jgi:hypothetical protein